MIGKLLMFRPTNFITLILLSTLCFACKKSEDSAFIEFDNTVVPDAIKKNFKANHVLISANKGTVTLRSFGIPNHVSPYWGKGSPMYEAQTSGQTLTPSTLTVQSFAMTIWTNPVEASVKEPTSLGPIGMALNGVAIYNDREGGNVPVEANTLTTFDRGGGHVGPGGLYHYHFDGDFTSYDDANLIGYLRDGFPIYGRKDSDGNYPLDLDVNGGHVGVTADYPNGIYHYHSAQTSYLNSRFYVLKSGSYHGVKGTFTY
jgi:hypothetical protein